MQDMSRIFKIGKIFRMSFCPNRRAGACLPQQDFQDVQDAAGFFVAERAGSGAPALQSGAAPVVRDRLIANMSVSMLSVIPTQARDRPSPYGEEGASPDLTSRGSIDIKVLRT